MVLDVSPAVCEPQAVTLNSGGGNMRRGETAEAVGFIAFLLAYFIPPATGLYVAYLAWTNWAEDWHWALKVPACLVAFGVWTGIFRVVTMMLLTSTTGLLAALFTPSAKPAGNERAARARRYRKHLLGSFAVGGAWIVSFIATEGAVGKWPFLIVLAVVGLYYGTTFLMAASMVWGRWWASGALLVSMLLNRGPYAILSVVPLVALVWSLRKAAREPAAAAPVTTTLSPQ